MVLFLLSAWSSPSAPFGLSFNDKVVHLALYTVLGVGLGYGRYRVASSVPHVLLLGIGALYGASDEWHQGFVVGRSPAWGDWFADVAGVAVGYGLVLVLLARLAHRAKPEATESRRNDSE